MRGNVKLTLDRPSGPPSMVVDALRARVEMQSQMLRQAEGLRSLVAEGRSPAQIADAAKRMMADAQAAQPSYQARFPNEGTASSTGAAAHARLRTGGVDQAQLFHDQYGRWLRHEGGNWVESQGHWDGQRWWARSPNGDWQESVNPQHWAGNQWAPIPTPAAAEPAPAGFSPEPQQAGASPTRPPPQEGVAHTFVNGEWHSSEVPRPAVPGTRPQWNAEQQNWDQVAVPRPPYNPQEGVRQAWNPQTYAWHEEHLPRPTEPGVAYSWHQAGEAWAGQPVPRPEVTMGQRPEWNAQHQSWSVKGSAITDALLARHPRPQEAGVAHTWNASAQRWEAARVPEPQLTEGMRASWNKRQEEWAVGPERNWNLNREATPEQNAAVWMRELQDRAVARANPARPTTPADVAQTLGSMRYGLEFELAARHPALLDARRGEVPTAGHEAVLGAVNRALGQDAGRISLQRMPDGGHEATLLDAHGRSWKVVQEYVDSGARANGFELVTPPLTHADIPLVQRVRSELNQDFTHGIRSSSHVTFDASHLVTPHGDATKLVNSILYVENHWKELYTAVAPERYGTTVNKFAVPLGVNQPQLLQELAGLRDKSIGNVQAVFDRHAARELALNPGTDVPYKYRAANYAKLFPTDGGPRLLEFRVGDLVSADEYPKMIRVLGAAVQKGAELGHGARYEAPFGSRVADLHLASDSAAAQRQLDPLNAAIRKVSDAKYNGFLRSLGLSREAYPRAPETPADALRLSNEELKSIVAAIPRNAPIDVTGGRLSFGFEAEYKETPENAHIFTNGAINHDLFPYLSGKFHREGTGSMEIDSTPTEHLGEVIQQMRHLKENVGPTLRGFHFTIQTPTEAVTQVGESNFKGWLTRASDAVFGWRLKNRKTLFSLNAWSQQRQDPFTLRGRGTIRSYNLNNGRYRIETRGLMGSVDAIDSMAGRLIAGLRDPSLIRGFALEHAALAAPDPRASMQALMEGFKGSPLTLEEQGRLNSMITPTMTDHYGGLKKGLLTPFSGYESSPFLTRAERIRYKNASWDLAQKAWQLVQREDLSNHLALNSRYRQLVKNWSDQVDFMGTMEKSILTRPGVNATSEPYLLQRIGHLVNSDQNVKQLFNELLPTASTEFLQSLRAYLPEGSNELTMLDEALASRGGDAANP